MSKIMLVNVTHVEESRVAILENGVMEAYEIETIIRANIKGNIYNAVVENVHPSLEAAFVRLTPDLKGFLPLDEVNFKLLPVRGERGKGGRIGQHLHSGQRILAQVVREPFAGKPPTVSTYFSLPGRYLVLMPGVDSDGISRKIEDPDQRDRLKKMIEELNAPEGFGVIIRTAGVTQTRTELQRDLRYLLRLWESIKRASGITDFPGLVYRERDLVIRTMRDYFTPDISEVWIDSPETYEHALEFVRDVMPGKAKTIHLYSGDRPLFSKYNLEDQIDSIYKRRVLLPSGGEIIIDGTEALTAIDVNSARSTRKGDAEETALQTNMEAASEIARQLRLRDLGGLLVVDFIDMMASRNQRNVEKAMRDAMKGDRAKYDVTRISKLGLLEISRQRIRSEKMSAMYATCPSCEGYGLVKNVEAAALAALRKLQVRCTRGDFGRMRLAVPPEVASWVLNHKREDLLQLEKRHNIRISVETKSSLLRHEAEFETMPREKAEAPPALVAPDRPLPPLPPDMVDVGVTEPAAPAPSPVTASPAPSGPAEIGQETVAEEATEGSAPGRKRRRRRRRHGRVDAATPLSPDVGQTAGDRETVPGEVALRPSRSPESPTSPAGGEAPASPIPAISPHGEMAPARAATSGDAFEDEGPGFASLPGESGDSDADDSEAGDGSATGDSVDGDQSPGRKRRRRRRRRRGRGAGIPAQETKPAASPEQASDPAPSAPVLSLVVLPAGDSTGGIARGPEEDPGSVPKTVRSEELLPAATGGRRPREAEGGARRWPRRGGPRGGAGRRRGGTQ